MAVRPACSRLSIQKPVSSAPIRGVSKFQGDVTSLFRSSGDLAEPRLWPVIPAPCARVERMMPAAQAGGTRAAEQRAVLPARPSGPAPVLGTRAGARGVQSRRKRVPRPPEAWSCWRAAEPGELSCPSVACTYLGNGLASLASTLFHGAVGPSSLSVMSERLKWIIFRPWDA